LFLGRLNFAALISPFVSEMKAFFLPVRIGFIPGQVELRFRGRFFGIAHEMCVGILKK
jgi:hypothetical protein